MDILHLRENGPQRFYLPPRTIHNSHCQSLVQCHIPLPLSVPTITFNSQSQKARAPAHRKHSPLSWKAEMLWAFIFKADCMVSFGRTVRVAVCALCVALSTCIPVVALLEVLGTGFFLAHESCCRFA